MTSKALIETPHWFVLNHIGINIQATAKRIVDKFNARGNCEVELFAPTYVIREEKEGQIKLRTANLTFHYVFVRGTHTEIKKLCGENNGFSFLIDHGNQEQRYAMISDREMANFKNIARAYKNCLPYFPLDHIDLEEGDLVEVINGDFPGLIGTYMPKAKSNSGNIILNVFNNVGTIAFNIKAKDVRVLEFSRRSTRANDQIDAFVPCLLNALRFFHNDEALPEPLIAKLSVFCRRMEVLKLCNHKLDARLQVLLFGGNSILGNIEEAALAMSKYEKIKDSVTNEWTSALIALIIAVITGKPAMSERVWADLKQLKPASRSQHMILDEYAYYNA